MLVRGEVLAQAPPGARTLTLPYSLDPGAGSEPALARVDVEELYAFGRPELETIEVARDLYISDGTAGALLRIAGADNRLHPEVDLRLAAPFVEHALEPPLGALRRTAFVRVLRAGDPLYVFGRASIEQDSAGLVRSGYREPALMAGVAA